MPRSFIVTTVYYLLGFALAEICYLIFGWEYIHVPGIHHIIIILTFAGGLIWAIIATSRYMISKDKKQRVYATYNFIIVILFFVVLLYWINDSFSSVPENSEYPEETLTIEHSGDTSRILHKGNIIYLSVKDSVILDFIDSINFEVIP